MGPDYRLCGKTLFKRSDLGPLRGAIPTATDHAIGPEEPSQRDRPQKGTKRSVKAVSPTRGDKFRISGIVVQHSVLTAHSGEGFRNLTVFVLD